MRHLLKNKKALSTVVTTLIILVISVLLATVVTYYAMNMVSTRVIQEDGRITQMHIWVNCTDGPCHNASAVVVFKNTGGRDVLVEKLTIRYQSIPWADMRYQITNGSVTDELDYVCNQTLTLTDYAVPTDAICLETGQSITVYVQDPGTIDCLDIGTSIPAGIHTSNAIYYKEANVESTT